MFHVSVQLGIIAFPLWGFALLCALVLSFCTFYGTRKSLIDCELNPGRFPLVFSLFAAPLAVGFVIAVLGLQSQHTPVVIPTDVGRSWRVIYHLSLICLLLMVTATDLRSFYIATWNCWFGMALGLLGAVISGQFQLEHVWVDWNQEVPQIQGPYLPAWLAAHQHLHGLAWSMCGLVTGVILAGGTQIVSAKLLQKATLGSGDVYLMAMIGAYLGWQPTIVAFAIAPIFAIVFGLTFRSSADRPALPYGPFLALGAVVVLFCWRWIWMLEIPLTTAPQPARSQIFAVRRFFGDWQSMLIAAGLGITLFVLLLSLLRYYKSLEFKRTDKPNSD